MNSLTKSKLLLISLILSGASLFFGNISNSNQCFLGYNKCESLAYFLGIFIPTLVLSILFYFLRDSLFSYWKKFLFWYIPLSIFLIMISANSPSDFFPIYKKTVFIITTLILILTSLLIIIYKSFKKE